MTIPTNRESYRNCNICHYNLKMNFFYPEVCGPCLCVIGPLGFLTSRCPSRRQRSCDCSHMLQFIICAEKLPNRGRMLRHLFQSLQFLFKKKIRFSDSNMSPKQKKTSAAERPCRERLLPLALYVFFYKALLTPVLCIQPNNILMISTKRSQFHNFIVSFHIFAFFKIGKVNIHRNQGNASQLFRITVRKTPSQVSRCHWFNILGVR